MTKLLNKIQNLACPFCGQRLNGKDFYGGKWQCRKCKKPLTFEEYKKVFPKAKLIKSG